MHHVWIAWTTAAEIAAVLVIAVVATRSATNRWVVGARTTGRELALVLALYAVWQRAHELAVTKVAGATDHALWLIDVEKHLHLPSELSLQKAVLPYSLLVQLLNGYYAVVHVPALIATLIWLFFWHRDSYPWVRNTLALATAACLLIQSIPMAPPRMFPQLGYVDTGLLYNQSVYGRGGSGISNQLAAMPSVHVAWAVVVTLAVLAVSTSRWRWLILLHPFLTVVAVTATANHWYLDGVVAAGLVGLGLALQWAATRALGWARRPAVATGRAVDDDEPRPGEPEGDEPRVGEPALVPQWGSVVR